DFRRKAFFFPEQAQQQVLGADVLMIQTLGFLGAVSQHALALVAERQIDRRRNLFPNRGMPFDLFPDRIDSRMRSEKPVGQRLILPKQAQQQMLRLDVRASKLARLVPREKY